MSKKEKTKKTKASDVAVTQTDRASIAHEDEPKKSSEKTNNNPSDYHYRRKAETWLWFGVIVITVVMILFWVFSVKWQISYFSKNNTEKTAVQQVQESWNKAFDESKTASVKEDAKKQIKAALDKMMAEEKIKNASSTTSTPDLTTTSTTATTTI